jgi:hypothetical protein
LNETLLWLLYCVSGLLAFASVHKSGWPIGLALLWGLLITGAGWALIYQLTEEEKRPDWVQLDLTLNLTFGLIFAAAGAGLAKYLITRREPSE